MPLVVTLHVFMEGFSFIGLNTGKHLQIIMISFNTTGAADGRSAGEEDEHTGMTKKTLFETRCYSLKI